MPKGKLPMLVAAGAAFLLLRKGAQGAYKSIVHEEVMKHRDRMYQVGPNCEITPRATTETAQESERGMESLWTEFVEPIVHEQWADGEFLLGDLATAVMKQLFPEEQCSWPPTQDAPESQKVAYMMMRTFIAQGLACDPENPTANLPEGQVCFEEVVDEGLADWMVMSYNILKIIRPWYASYLEPFVVDEEVSIYYRAPEHLVLEYHAVAIATNLG